MTCKPILGILLATAAAAQTMPEPAWKPGDVVRIAREHRAEVIAARARVRAAVQRPAIVGALEDPMVSPQIDHLPYQLGGVNCSISVEQRFPLPSVRRNREKVALAEIDRSQADVGRTALDVELEALNAYFMLHERREMARIVREQLTLSRQVVSAANARYAGGTGTQSEVLRAEVEVARLEAITAAFQGEIAAAEAMLNASLGRESSTAVPPLDVQGLANRLPDWQSLAEKLGQRPELAGGRADIERASAEVRVMRDMYKPMFTVRVGTAYTMTDGRGAMLMVGVSLPIWRKRLRAGVAEAEAMREMAQADLNAMTRMVEGQGASAYRQVEGSQARNLLLRTEVVPRARNAIGPVLASYAAGRLPLVSVLEAVQTLWIAQADLLQSDVELGLARARLGRAIGAQEGILP